MKLNSAYDSGTCVHQLAVQPRLSALYRPYGLAPGGGNRGWSGGWGQSELVRCHERPPEGTRMASRSPCVCENAVGERKYGFLLSEPLPTLRCP